MKVNTRHKTFNKQTNLIGGTGSVIARTFFKWHISRESADYDYKAIELYKPPEHVTSRVAGEIAVRDIYVAVLYHINRNSRYVSDFRVAHGFIVMDMAEHLIQYYITGPSWKSASVVLWCLPLVAKMTPEQQWHLDRLRKECEVRWKKISDLRK